MRSSRKRKNKFVVLLAIFLPLLLIAAGVFVFFEYKKKIAAENMEAAKKIDISNIPADIPSFAEILPLGAEERTPPPPVDMNRLKAQGCVADGLLTEYNPDQGEFLSLIGRSHCYYLHRAVETWLEPPDFEVIEKNLNQMTKRDVVYGMFLAEAIGVKDDYENEDTGHVFDFKEMCHDESINEWGEHTCRPTFSSVEYRNYLKYITRRAIDLGVQSFTFGQIYMQESDKRNYAPVVVRDIRRYAKEKNVDVVIGAQTGSIADPKYLGLFDYIEGGVGIDSEGNIENGPCLSRRGSCWALLWNKTFSAKAKNVLLHLDWSGIPSDDLDIFARMDAKTRARTLQNLYGYFRSQNMGFLMPYFGVLARDNGGCIGPKKRFYSPDNAYGCRDGEVISKILSKK